MARAQIVAALVVAAGCSFNPGLAQHALVQGDMMLVQKDYRGAIGMYDQAIAGDPYLREAYLHRGIAYRGNGNFERALADFAKAVELDPNYGPAYTERARTRLAMIAARADGDQVALAEAFGPDDPHKLAADLDRAVALEALSGDGTALLLRGAVRLMGQQDAEAQKDFDRFVRRRQQVKGDLEQAVEKWKRERPVLDLSLVDELCRHRPLKG
jgi:tetratricopeptide (TPR) repeat protein